MNSIANRVPLYASEEHWPGLPTPGSRGATARDVHCRTPADPTTKRECPDHESHYLHLRRQPGRLPKVGSLIISCQTIARYRRIGCTVCIGHTYWFEKKVQAQPHTHAPAHTILVQTVVEFQM